MRRLLPKLPGLSRLVFLASLVLLPGVGQAADIVINNGLDCSNSGNVIDHDTYQSDNVYVRNVGCGTSYPWSRCDFPGDATEVCVTTGGHVTSLYAFDSSTATVSGGWVTDRLNAENSSTVTINSGTVGLALVAYQSSTVTINGGTLEGVLEAIAWTRVTINGGTLGDLYVNGTSSCSVAVNGGTVGGFLQAEGLTTVTLSDGNVGWLVAYGSSSITISGGTVDHGLYSTDSSTVTMSGGAMGNWVVAYGSSTVTLSGGDVPELDAYESSSITVTGTGFAVDGSPALHGELTAGTGTLTGRLASRDLINSVFHQEGSPGYTGTITLAPPDYLVVPALSLSGKLMLAATLLGSAVIWRRGLR